MLRLAVLVSGGGTNLQAILDAITAGSVTNTEVVKVISNSRKAYALERAAAAGDSDGLRDTQGASGCGGF